MRFKISIYVKNLSHKQRKQKYYDRNKIIFNFTFSLFFSQLILLRSLGQSTREFSAYTCLV